MVAVTSASVVSMVLCQINGQVVSPALLLLFLSSAASCHYLLKSQTDGASASDPIFWLHHANMDRFWWSWQSKNLSARLSDFSGPLVQMDYDNEQGGNATLNTEIRIGQSVNITMKVRDVMNIQGNVLCYKYDKLY